jgi:outer membrane protein TolC
MELARETALRQRPDLVKARLQTAYSDYGVRLSRAAFIPDASLVVRYISPVTADQLPKNIAYAGIEISWDIWDWGKKRSALAQSEKAREQARNAAEDAASQVVLDVNGSVRKLRDAETFLNVSQLNRDYARESLREVTNQFRQQSALLKDVLAAQAALGQAQSQYQQAVLSYWEARASLDKALGTDQ